MPRSTTHGILNRQLSALILCVGAILSTNLLRLADNQSPLEAESAPTAVFAIAQRWQSRLSADGTMPENALLKALNQRSQITGTSEIQPAFSAWTWLGPANIGGRIRTILVHPTNPNIMYTGAVGGGVWKTIDAGANWFPLDGFMPAIGVCCMAMDPANPETLYAGTGEGFFESVEGTQTTAAIRGAGIYKSTDGGLNWSHISSTAGSDWYFVNRLAIPASNPNIILAATSSGIWKSTNGGASWVRVWTGHAYDVRFHPSNSNLVIAGTHDTPGGLYSSNGGDTWQNSTGISDVHRAELKWAPSAATTCYALVASHSQQARIYKSTNSGQTWVIQAAASISTYRAYNLALWVDPTNANYLVYGAVSLYRSTDGGASRTSAFANIHSDHHDIINHPQFNGTTNRKLFFAGDGGVGYTNDSQTGSGGHLNNGLGITQFYGGAYSPSGKIIAGAQDNYTNLYSGSLNWTIGVIGGDGGFAAADPTDANYLYGSSQVLGIRRSTNNGSSFSSITSGLSDAGSTARCNFIPHYILDPNNANTMLACGLSLWRSSNVKAATPTWSAIKAPIGGDYSEEYRKNLSHMEVYDPRFISTVTVAPGNSNIIWVGHNNGEIYKTTNGLSATPSWTSVEENFPGTSVGRWVSKIVIDPSNNNRVLVSFLGWNDNNLWLTTNAGTSWSQITGTSNRRLPVVPISAVALDPLRLSRIFVGTDIGLFVSNDNGNSWGAVTEGPDTCPIDELVWKDNDELLNVTHGRGLYVANVTPISSMISPSSFIVSGAVRSGTLSSLLASDNNRLHLGRQGASSFHIEVSGTAAFTNPWTMTLNYESQGGPGQNLIAELYNFDAASYEIIETIPLTNTDVARSVSLSGNISRFIEPITRNVKARLRYVLIDTRPWPKQEAYVDHVSWTMEH